MVSHKHKVIFVHIPKAAGSSVEDLFLRDLNLNFQNAHSLLIGNSFNKNLGPRQFAHLTAKEYTDLSFISKKLFDEYFKFSIVRNPYDRLYSTYKYLRFDQLISFDSFVTTKLNGVFKNKRESYFYKPQYEYLYNEDKLLVDFVGKLDSFDDDMCHVKIRLNLESLPIVHKNKSSNRKTNISTKVKNIIKVFINDRDLIKHINFKVDTIKVLSEESIGKVNKVYHNDFIHFNYNKL
jgi:hypothetical protein